MRAHRKLVPTLLVLAVVMGFLGVFATWVKRQALDSDHWANTSSKLLADEKIQAALGSYLTAQLFANVDVEAAIEERLPPQIQGLAGPVAGGLRNLAEQRVPKLLARPAVQDAWVTANRASHAQLMRVLDDKGTTVSTANGDVVLDTRALLQQLAGDVGISVRVPALPPKTGQLVILQSDELATAQSATKGIRGLSIVLTILTFGLFALAVWLAKGWRRETLRTVGWCMVGVGMITLLLRRVFGNQIVEALVENDSAKPAVHQVWWISTSLLYAIAIAAVVYGLVIVASAWIAGPSRSGVASRRWLAPTLRERPGMTFGALGFVYLLVLAWGPTPAFRNWIPVVLIGIAATIGLEALRRQAALEFPPVPAVDENGKRPVPVDLDKDLALGAS